MKNLILIAGILSSAIVMAQTEVAAPELTPEQQKFKAEFPEHYLPTEQQLKAALLAVEGTADSTVSKNAVAAPYVRNLRQPVPAPQKNDLGVIVPHNFFTITLDLPTRR